MMTVRGVTGARDSVLRVVCAGLFEFLNKPIYIYIDYVLYYY